MSIVTDVNCDLCQETSRSQLSSYYLYKGHRCYHVKCAKCGLIYVCPRPVEQDLFTLYSVDYFSSGGNTGSFGNHAYVVRRERGPHGTIAKLETMAHLLTGGRAPYRLLEIGCADGFFLQTAQRCGWQVFGVDVSTYAATYGSRNCGLNIFAGTVEQAGFPANHFDAVYMGDVLEHLPSPKGTLTEIHRILVPAGILALEVPTFYSSIYCILGRSYLRFCHLLTGREHQLIGHPLHLFEFTPRTLRMLLQACGFSIIREFIYENDPDSIGLSSVRYFAKVVSAIFSRTVARGRFGDKTLVYARRI